MNKTTPVSKKRKAIEIAISVAIAGGILGFLFSRINLADLRLIISEISVAVLVLVFVLVIVINMLRAYRFRVLLSEKGIPFVRLTGTVLICNFITGILPAGIGQLSYPAFFRRNFAVPLSKGIAVLLVARIFDLMAICFIFLLSAVSAQAIPAAVAPAIYTISWIVLGVLLLLVLGVALVRFSDRFAYRLQSLMEKLLSRGPLFAQKGAAKVIEGLSAVKVINSPANLSKVLLSSLGIWVCMYLEGFILLTDLNVGLDIATSFVGQSLTLITIILPVQGIGGFGSFEGTWAAAFFLLGVPKAVAISSGLIIHLIMFINRAILGLVGVFVSRQRFAAPDG